jgi:N6-adenosine-specific RNA methylase IME4
MIKLYDVIYADPPWRYSFSKSSSRKIENHYNTMTLDDICSLQVPSKENSVLYLWATAPKLIQALKVMDE